MVFLLDGMSSNLGEEDEKTKRLRWMFMQQQKQQLSWDDEKVDTSRVGLRIIVLQNMFSLAETTRLLFKNRMNGRAKLQIGALRRREKRLRGVWRHREDYDLRHESGRDRGSEVQNVDSCE